MQVEIYDQFLRVENEDGTLLHANSGSAYIAGEFNSQEEANKFVTSEYKKSKLLGQSDKDKIIKLNEGYAELLITFADKKELNRVIWIKK